MPDVSRIDELDLLAYADGLLDHDPARRAAVEAVMTADPEAIARAEAFRAQTAALREVYDRRLAEPVPERLVAVLDRPDASQSGPVLRVAAVACLIVGAGTAGWLLGQGDGERESPGAEMIDRSYAQFVAERPGEMAPAMGRAVAEAKPLGWLAEEVSIRLKAPDLSGEGFSLVDKKAIVAGDTQMVRLDYSAGDGRAFSLFIAPRWDDGPVEITPAERDGVSLAYWLDGPLASAVATRMPADEAEALAEAVHEALQSGGAPPAVLDPAPSGPRKPRDGMMADTLADPAVETHPQPLRVPTNGATKKN